MSNALTQVEDDNPNCAATTDVGNLGELGGDGVSPLEEAIAQFERISVGAETEGSFDGVGGRICGVYEAHERVIALFEGGAPLCLGSQWLLEGMAEALEEFKAQGVSVGAKKEVRAVLACAKRLHGAPRP